MSLDLVILPVNEQYEMYSDEILKKIKAEIPFPLDIEILKDYQHSLLNRVSKQRQLDKIIIVVDDSYITNSNIIVRFSDKHSKARKMNIIEFIDICSSFEDEYLKDNDLDINLKEEQEDKKEDINLKEKEEESGCIIG